MNRGCSLAQGRARPLRRQRGVAVITALLLTTLAVTIVASLFWQQQVQVRSMENQRLQLQTRWILRGALDWSRLILFQDGVDTAGVGFTSLTGVWATPLAETRLDDYVERERVEGESFDATLSGQLSDAQSRYNLANLAYAKTQTGQLTVFQQLLSNLQIDPGLAQKVADQVARKVPLPNGAPAQPAGGGSEPLDLVRVEDLLAVSGFTQQAIERLRDFVIVLPAPTAPTAINVNTAPAELLAALVQNYSVSEAAALVYNSKRIPYRTLSAFTQLLNNHALVQGVDIDVKSNFFLAQSRVRLDRATLDTQALLQRDPGTHRADVRWIREN